MPKYLFELVDTKTQEAVASMATDQDDADFRNAEYKREEQSLEWRKKNNKPIEE